MSDDEITREGALIKALNILGNLSTLKEYRDTQIHEAHAWLKVAEVLRTYPSNTKQPSNTNDDELLKLSLRASLQVAGSVALAVASIDKLIQKLDVLTSQLSPAADPAAPTEP